MIKELDVRIKPASDTGIFHDTRGDVRNLSLVCNLLINKVNELTRKVNELESKVKA